MKENGIQIIAWFGIAGLLIAIFGRKTYLRITRKRWPSVEATLKGIEGDVRISSVPEYELGFQPQYPHNLIYSFNGVQYERQMSYPKIQKGTIRLRVNPADPKEAYFENDLDQSATFVQGARRN